MHSMPAPSALIFEDVTFDVVDDRPGEVWLKHLDVGKAIGFLKPQVDAIDFFHRRTGLFNEAHTRLIYLKHGDSRTRANRVFSLHGAAIMAEQRRGERAFRFRAWLQQQIELSPEATLIAASLKDTAREQQQPRRPAAKREQTKKVEAPPDERMFAALMKVMSQRDALRRHLIALDPRLNQVMRYHAIEKLDDDEKARLLGVNDGAAWRAAVEQALDMGLIDPPQPAARVVGDSAAIHEAKAKAVKA